MDSSPYTLTMIQRITLNLVYAALDEPPYHVTYDDTAIIAKLPPLKILLHQVNQLLRAFHKSNGCKCNATRIPEICRFRPGDKYIVVARYPTEISYETLRATLVRAGLRSERDRSLSASNF